jgi:hypothetical protein
MVIDDVRVHKSIQQCLTTFEGVRRLVSKATLCYPIVLPGQKSGLRAGVQPDSDREGFNIGPVAGLRLAGGPFF